MLPTAITEFSRKSEDPDVGPRELGAVIESDTGLTCELLRYANSSVFALRNKAASAQQAIAMMGIRQSKLFILSTGVKAAMSSQASKLINLRNFWTANLERALFAREVAKLLRADPDLAFAGAMLQDCLLPIVTNELSDVYTEYFGLEDSQASTLADFENAKLGWDHALATARVMLSWKFPDDLVCCVLFHHRGIKLLADDQLGATAAAAVAISGLVPDSIRQVRTGLDELMQLDAVWPDFKLLELAATVDRQFREMSPASANHFSLLHRCEKCHGARELARAES